MNRPTKRSKAIIDRYNYMLQDHRSPIRSLAKELGVTRQAVDYVLKRYSHLVHKLEKEVEYGVCKICEMEMPKNMLYKKKCSHCSEQKIVRCVDCGVSFRNDPWHYFDRLNIGNTCVECRSKRCIESQKKTGVYNDREKARERWNAYRIKHNITPKLRIRRSIEEKKQRARDRARKSYVKKKLESFDWSI